jgi:PAS domain S-box-containing protein
MNTLAKILIVEDESIVAFNLQQRLAMLGYEVPAVAVSGDECLELVAQTQPDLVLMDIHIQGDMDGIDTSSRIKETHSVPVIYLTAYSEDSTLERARLTGPYGYLLKPFSERELHATIQMALERHKIELALHSSQRQLQQALNAGSMGVIELDLDRQLLKVSARTSELMGWPAQQPLCLSDLLSHVDPDARGAVLQRWETSLRELQSFSEEFRVLIEGQRARWIRIDASPMPQQRVSGVVQDITERKNAQIRLQKLNDGLENLVSERTAELRQSIKELESFSYAVAHDLRSPIRAIVGFSSILIEEHPANLGEGGVRLLERISSAGLRMGQLIDALLRMSRLSVVAMDLQPVDLSAMASEVAAQLMELEPERVADVRIAPGLHAMADPALMHSVFDNLLRNAWKFCAREAITRIEVGTESTGSETVFYVRDNGCGFDMSHADRLFGPFHRLHRDEDYAGTGIGLTIVQRIVLRHGGRVWARSAPGEGASFHFTLSP